MPDVTEEQAMKMDEVRKTICELLLGFGSFAATMATLQSVTTAVCLMVGGGDKEIAKQIVDKLAHNSKDHLDKADVDAIDPVSKMLLTLMAMTSGGVNLNMDDAPPPTPADPEDVLSSFRVKPKSDA